MKHYKTPDNQIFAYELDGSQDYLIEPNMVEITIEERDELIQLNEQAIFDALPYQEKRRLSYPPIDQFMEGLVYGDEAKMQAYINQYRAVDLAYPAPDSE
jgi:hypothetical protein